MNMKTHRTHPVPRWSVFYACLMFSATAYAENSTTQPFVLNAIVDASGGAEILDGDYGAAIQRIDADRRKAMDRVFAATNLCVAHTKAADVALAGEYCDTAVAEVEAILVNARSVRKHGYFRSDLKRYLAISLSNRGVLLAITGEVDAARSDFDAALALETRIAAVRLNIESLKERIETRA